MKKTLIMFLILLLLVTIGFMFFKSLKIGSIEVLGVKSLQEENKKLDASIQTLSRLSSTDYNQALTDITNSSKQYEQAKSEYEELATVSTDSEVGAASQLQKYEIEYLWTKIGNHATAENVVLKIEVKENSTSASTGYYDLNFTAKGDYVGLTDFLYDIENDSSLGFKIEGFKMEPSGNDLQASFTCTNIAINMDNAILEGKENDNNQNEQSSDNTEESKNNTTSNTTNTTTTDRQNGQASQTTEQYLNTTN